MGYTLDEAAELMGDKGLFNTTVNKYTPAFYTDGKAELSESSEPEWTEKLNRNEAYVQIRARARNPDGTVNESKPERVFDHVPWMTAQRIEDGMMDINFLEWAREVGFPKPQALNQLCMNPPPTFFLHSSCLNTGYNRQPPVTLVYSVQDRMSCATASTLTLNPQTPDPKSLNPKPLTDSRP